MFGAAVEKDRGTEKDPLVCRYRNGVRIHNWLENEEDREFLKFSRTAPISQVYQITISSDFRMTPRPLCNSTHFNIYNATHPTPLL